MRLGQGWGTEAGPRVGHKEGATTDVSLLHLWDKMIFYEALKSIFSMEQVSHDINSDIFIKLPQDLISLIRVESKVRYVNLL